MEIGIYTFAETSFDPRIGRQLDVGRRLRTSMISRGQGPLELSIGSKSGVPLPGNHRAGQVRNRLAILHLGWFLQ
ncbi:MAG TPA: hypothetical protein DCG16_00420 [Gemmatimonadetes bacterium]|nr:hypothetical protein [Gemmatimonadota bacterium]